MDPPEEGAGFAGNMMGKKGGAGKAGKGGLDGWQDNRGDEQIMSFAQ